MCHLHRPFVCVFISNRIDLMYVSSYFLWKCQQKIKCWFLKLPISVCLLLSAFFVPLSLASCTSSLWMICVCIQNFRYSILHCWNLFIATILFENYGLNIYWRYHSAARIKYEPQWTNAHMHHAEERVICWFRVAMMWLPTLFTGNDFMIDEELTIWR